MAALAMSGSPKSGGHYGLAPEVGDQFCRPRGRVTDTAALELARDDYLGITGS